MFIVIAEYYSGVRLFYIVLSCFTKTEHQEIPLISLGGEKLQLPTPDEFEEMKASLKFKADELRKAESTAQGLLKERSRIYEDLQVFLSSYYIRNKLV